MMKAKSIDNEIAGLLAKTRFEVTPELRARALKAVGAAKAAPPRPLRLIILPMMLAVFLAAFFLVRPDNASLPGGDEKPAVDRRVSNYPDRPAGDEIRAVGGGDNRWSRVWSIEALAREAEVIAIGEVTKITPVEHIPGGPRGWPPPLLKKQAEIRVLRAYFSQTGARQWIWGPKLIIPFQVIDRKGEMRYSEEPQFPRLAVGDIRAFPLKIAAAGSTQPWQLLDDEDNGLLMPCARDPLPNAPRGNAVEFLQAELAGTLAKGRYEDVGQIAGQLMEYLMVREGEDPTGGIRRLLVGSLKYNDQRWLEIVVAIYSRSGSPVPTIDQLLSPPARLRPDYSFAAWALGQVSKDNLKERLFRLAMERAAGDRGASAWILLPNYDAMARKILEQALAQNRPEALRVAVKVIRGEPGNQIFIKIKGKPVPKEWPPAPERKALIPATVAAADRLLSRPGRIDDDYLHTAARLIRSYGGKAEFSRLLEEIRLAGKTDRKRYDLLWRSTFDWSKTDKPQRSIAVCAILLEDRIPVTEFRLGDRESYLYFRKRDPKSEKARYCDMAVYALQKFSGGDFGYRFGGSRAEHDQAVEKAKAWLLRHPPKLE
jgi:hypothetical protein